MAQAVTVRASGAAINSIVSGSTWIYAPGPVKYRQLLRARCTQEARYNKWGERTRTEDHPAPHMLTDDEAETLGALEQKREDERYVSSWEVRAWAARKPIQYEWGVYDPRKRGNTR